MSLFRPQGVTSHAPQQHVVQPIQQNAAMQDMNPYRGEDTHGVHHTATPHDVPLNTATARQHFTPQQPEHEPVPVRIVSQGGREFRKWFVIREVATNVARSIAGRQIERTNMTIQNLGTVPLWIGPDSSVAQFSGYRLDAGKERALTAQSAVWCVSDDGTSQPVAILIELATPVEAASAIQPGL